MNNDKLFEKAKKIKAVLCDVDGTLVNNDKEITDFTAATIKKAAKNGIFVSICSGRVAPMLSVMTNKLDIKGPVVSVNGGLIVDSVTGDKVFGKKIPSEMAREIFSFSLEKGIDCGAVVSTGAHFTKDSRRVKIFEKYNVQAKQSGQKPLVLTTSDKPDVVDFEDVYKFLILAKNQDEYNTYRKHFEQNKNLFVVSSEKFLIELMPCGVNKGLGVLEIAKLMGITPDEVMVFGDFENDKEMFETAGFCVAMGNATDDIKELSDYVTDTNQNDGVAKAIEKFLL